MQRRLRCRKCGHDFTVGSATAFLDDEPNLHYAPDGFCSDFCRGKPLVIPLMRRPPSEFVLSEPATKPRRKRKAAA